MNKKYLNLLVLNKKGKLLKYTTINNNSDSFTKIKGHLTNASLRNKLNLIFKTETAY